jgi:surfactin synthase thioesterase subunit
VARALGAKTDVLAVQYPGRQDRRGEPLVATIGELADQIFEVLRPQADLPLVLFGRSMPPAIRSDYRAAETYRWAPGPPLTCPVIALRGTEDPRASEAETLAWQRHTTGGFAMRSFPGGHFFLSNHAAEINRLIGERLAGVAARQPVDPVP